MSATSAVVNILEEPTSTNGPFRRLVLTIRAQIYFFRVVTLWSVDYSHDSRAVQGYERAIIKQVAFERNLANLPWQDFPTL